MVSLDPLVDQKCPHDIGSFEVYGILTYTTVYLSMFRPNPTMKVGDLISHEIPMICSHVSSVQTNSDIRLPRVAHGDEIDIPLGSG